MLGLAGCQSVDESTTGTATVVQESGYPSLHTVPPRPQLSYTVEQRRTIVDGLIADRENARYTSEVVRYRAGLSDMPPPEPRAVAAVPPEGRTRGGKAASPPAAEPQDAPAAETEFIERDDDLGSFMQEMLEAHPADQRRTEPGGEPEARAAPPREEVVRPAVAPPASARGPSATTAANEPERAAPSPAPTKPPVPAAMARADAATPEVGPLATANADDAAPRPQPKPAPGAPQIEVANGLVAIAVAPGDDDMDLGAIAFGPGSAALPPDAQSRLEELLGEANAHGSRVRIVGEAEAPALALDRARAVGLALVQRGLSADRLEMTLADGAAGDRARLFLASPQPR